MPQDRTSQKIQLSDGRDLGFAEFGPGDGEPIFYFSGGNSSRIEGKWFESAAEIHGVRLIVPDRPGFGLSTNLYKRQLLEWPKDVNELANYLGVDNFSLFGLSGGGPHVLATAFKAAERLNKVAIVSGTAPPDMPNKYRGMWPPVKLIFFTADKFPSINRYLLIQMANFYSDEEQMLKRMTQAMPKADIELINRSPEIIKIFSESAKEAHKNGVEGDAHEWQLYVRPWQFQLVDIEKEIRLWYGKFDRQVPIEMGRYLDQKLPNSQLIEVDDGGHFSTINNHIDDIFDYLIQK